MFAVKFMLLWAIGSSSLFVNCNSINDDFFGSLKHIYNIDFNRIGEFLRERSQNLVQTRHSNVDTHYDDVKCLEQMQILTDAVNNTEEWALKVIDSWGKAPSGVLSGNFLEQGDFDQCLSVTVAEKFEPQYCLGMLKQRKKPENKKSYATGDAHGPQTASMSIQRSARLFGFGHGPRTRGGGDIADGQIEIGLTTGVCVPNTCAPKMINEMIIMAIAQIPNSNIQNYTYEVKANTCQGNDETIYSSRDIAAITLLSFLAFLGVLSTGYDILCTRLEKNKIDVLTAFSLHTNTAKLFATKRVRSVDVLECLNGIRVLSAIAVIYGHVTVITFPTPLYNIVYVPEWAKGAFAMTLLMAPLSVDTFFFLSGLLVTWQLLKQFNRNNGRINVPLLYLHRYLRLTPVLAVAIFVTMTILTKYSNGPLWHVLIDGSSDCDANWWGALLYIQNYFNSEKMCFTHSWYLSVDFQLFLVAPLLVFLLRRFGKKVFPLLVVASLASVGSVIVQMWRYNLTTKYMDLKNNLPLTMDLTYFPTHARMAPWLVGMMFAYLMFQVKGKRVNFTKRHAFISWTALLTIFGLCAWYTHVIQQFDRPTTPIESGIYLALTRTFWPIAVALLVLVCVRGYGGPINRFLSSPKWLPYCRLSYAIYIVHMPIVLIFTASSRRSFYFSTQTLLIRFFGILVISFGVCVIASLLCESPIVKIENFIFGRNRKPVERTESPASTSANSQEDLLKRQEQSN